MTTGTPGELLCAPAADAEAASPRRAPSREEPVHCDEKARRWQGFQIASPAGYRLRPRRLSVCLGAPAGWPLRLLQAIAPRISRTGTAGTCVALAASRIPTPEAVRAASSHSVRA